MTAAGGAAAATASLDDLTGADWSRLNPGRRLDHGLDYVRFRCHVEPGEPVVAVVTDERGLAGAAYATTTTPRTALFSHPWKLLGSAQFVRAADGATAVLDEHARLVAAAGGGGDGAAGDASLAEQLAEGLGDPLVVRLFDSSEVLVAPDLDGDGAAAVTAGLVGHLQRLVGDGAAGAVVFPYVHPADEPLRRTLAAAGFVAGRLTASCELHVPAGLDWDGLLQALGRNRRRRYLRELAAFEAAGLVLGEVDAAEHLERIAELEAQTAAAHGGQPDVAAIVRLRRHMVATFGPSLRVPVALAGDTIVACGVDVFDEHDYYGLVYGCDYGHPGRSTAYMCVGYYEPIRFCLARGVRRLRLGFEAFEAKLLRGAALTPRETWVWVPDPGRLAGLAALLRFLTGRADGHFAEQLVMQTRGPTATG